MASNPSKTSLSRVVRGSILIFLGNLLGAGAAFLTRIVAARHLGTSDYGLVILGLTTLNLLVIVALFGLPEGLARYIPRVETSTNLVYGSFLIAIPTAFLLAIGVILSADLFAAVLSEPRLPSVLIPFMIALPFVVVMRLGIGCLRGKEDAIGRVIVQNVCYQILAAILVFAGVILGATAVGITIGWISAYITAGLIAAYLLWSRTSLLRSGYGSVSDAMTSVTDSRMKTMFLFSIPLLVSEGLWLVIQQADNLYIGYFLPTSAVAVYDASFTISHLLLLFTGTVSFLFLPVFSDLHSNQKAEEMKQLYKITTKWLTLIALPAFILLLFFPSEILFIVFGSEFTAGSTALVILSMGFFVNIVMGLNRDGIMAIGRSDLVLKANVFAFVLNIGLNVFLIPKFGVSGAAVASATSFASTNLYWGYLLYKQAGIHPFSRSFVRSVGLILGCAVLLFEGSGILLEPSAPLQLLQLFVFSLIYLYIIIVVTDIEREILELLPPQFASLLRNYG